jgi:signal peptidase II
LKKPFLLIILVLIADQVLKFWVKTNMFLGQEFGIFGDWFIIHFTENYGMAFGLEFAGEYGKLFLTFFRLAAISGLSWYLYTLFKTKAHIGLQYSMALILAGAAGNLIDSIFYGVLFTDSNYRIAEFIPEDGGYASLFHGRVVDMFYFPIIKGYFPSWFPIWSNEYFIFFRPVFNIADASITVGVIIILLFQKRFFKTTEQEIETETKLHDDVGIN